MARVIFLTDFSEAYARELLLGMARYAHDTAQAWSLCRLPLSIRDKFGIEAVVEWAVRMKADAVIGQFYNTDNVGLFRENGIIAIAQDFKKRFTTIPNITGPHHLAGRMAAEYFLKKGFRNFAFYGTRGIDFSDERCQGFRETVEQANPDFTFSSLRSGAQNDLWYYDTAQLITWLQSLPKPVAIMACDDNQAYHIITRQSTDIYANNDPHIAEVLRYIHENISQKITVDDLVKLVPLSRRLLETRFKKSMGTSIYDYIIQTRIEKMMQLLCEGLSVSEAAAELGFSDIKNVSRTFRQLKGITPSEYREQVAPKRR